MLSLAVTPPRVGRARPILALIAALLAGLLLVCMPTAAGGATEITLLYDTHLHGNFGDDSLSLAHYAALVNRIRLQKPNTLFVGNGDDIATSLLSAVFKGEHMIDALNAAGLDFGTYGNHEFDYGPDNLLERVAQSEFTWVSANVIDRRTGDVYGAEVGALRYAVVEIDGVRIAITGIAPWDTDKLSNTGDDVVILDPAEALASLVPQMRSEASIVLVLSHESWPQTERIAATVPGVDIYVGDHSGQMIPEPKVIGDAIVSRVGDELDYLGELTLKIEDGAIVDWTFTLHDVRALVEAGALYPDVRVQRIIDRYKALAYLSLEEIVGYTRTPLDARVERVRTGETALGNFVADAIRAWAEADVAIMNGGGLRGDRIHQPGPLTRGAIVSILPFENFAIKLNVQGKTIVEALEHGVSLAEYGHGRFPHVSGITFTYDFSKPAGSRIVSVRVGDADIDPEAWYTLAIPDFLADGGDGYEMLIEAERIIPTEGGQLLSSVMIDAILAAGEIAPELEGRIVALGN